MKDIQLVLDFYENTAHNFLYILKLKAPENDKGETVSQSMMC